MQIKFNPQLFMENKETQKLLRLTKLFKRETPPWVHLPEPTYDEVEAKYHEARLKADEYLRRKLAQLQQERVDIEFEHAQEKARLDYEWMLYKEKHPKPETMGAIVLTEDELKATMERRENDMWGMIHADSN